MSQRAARLVSPRASKGPRETLLAFSDPVECETRKPGGDAWTGAGETKWCALVRGRSRELVLDSQVDTNRRGNDREKFCDLGGLQRNSAA